MTVIGIFDPNQLNEIGKYFEFHFMIQFSFVNIFYSNIEF